MKKSVTITVKLDQDKKTAFYEFCRNNGIMVNEFLETEERADHRYMKEASDIFFNDPADKKAVFDFEQLLKELKIRDEMH